MHHAPQSFPQLIVIAIYERFLARGQKWREASSGRAHDIYASLSRSVKHMPILDLLSSSSMDIHEAIFDVDIEGADDLDLFGDSDAELDFPTMPPAFSLPVIRTARSHESLRLPDSERDRQRSPLRLSGTTTPPDQIRRTMSASLSPRKAQSRSRARTRSAVSPRPDPGAASPTGSPRARNAALPTINPPSSTEVPGTGPRSPLGMLFGARRERLASVAGVEASVKRVETLVEEVRRMPVNRLKDEMKELQVRCLFCVCG